MSYDKTDFGTHPFLLGFEQLERLVERTAKTGNEGYPPYQYRTNVGEHPTGSRWPWPEFAEDDLAITVEDSPLVIRGRQSDDSEGRIYSAPRHCRAAVPAQFRAGRRGRSGRGRDGKRSAACGPDTRRAGTDGADDQYPERVSHEYEI